MQPVGPHRTVPLQIEVRQPIRRLDQGRALSGNGIGDPNPFGGDAIADLLRGRGVGSTYHEDISHEPIAAPMDGSDQALITAVVSPTALRAALIRLVSADSLTKRSPHTLSSSSALEMRRPRLATRYANTSSTCGSARAFQLDRAVVHNWVKTGYVPARWAGEVERVTQGRISALLPSSMSRSQLRNWNWSRSSSKSSNR